VDLADSDFVAVIDQEGNSNRIHNISHAALPRLRQGNGGYIRKEFD
jgi:hypothetical protein